MATSGIASPCFSDPHLVPRACPKLCLPAVKSRRYRSVVSDRTALPRPGLSQALRAWPRQSQRAARRRRLRLGLGGGRSSRPVAGGQLLSLLTLCSMCRARTPRTPLTSVPVRLRSLSTEPIRPGALRPLVVTLLVCSPACSGGRRSLLARSCPHGRKRPRGWRSKDRRPSDQRRQGTRQSVGSRQIGPREICAFCVRRRRGVQPDRSAFDRSAPARLVLAKFASAKSAR
jgi:hypothetical protein